MKKIILYGAGKIGRRNYKFFKFYHLEKLVYAFCDKNSENIGSVDNIPVFTYEALSESKVPFLISVGGVI